MPELTTPGELPTRTGYRFVGFYDEKSGGNQYYNADGTSANKWDKISTATLYAHWTANEYTVTFNNNGYGTPSPETKTVTFDSKYGELASMSKVEGYTFEGWYFDQYCTAGNEVISATLIRIW